LAYSWIKGLLVGENLTARAVRALTAVNFTSAR